MTNDAGASIPGGMFRIMTLGVGSSVLNAGTISGVDAAIVLNGGGTLTLGPLGSPVMRH